MKSVCCRQHLKTLIGHWLTQASLRLPPAPNPPLPTRLWPMSISAPTRWAYWSANWRFTASPFPGSGQVPPRLWNAS
jgi:hypothetical protein